MSKSLFIMSSGEKSGKSTISLGIMETLIRNVDKVGFFKPIINNAPHGYDSFASLDLISKHFNLNLTHEDMYGFTNDEAIKLENHGKNDYVLDVIIKKYKNLQKKSNFVLCEGNDCEGSSCSYQLNNNAKLANFLGCPILLVINCVNKNIDEIYYETEIFVKSIKDAGSDLLAIILNKVEKKNIQGSIKKIKEKILDSDQLIYAMPYDKFLILPTVGDISHYLHAKPLYREDMMDFQVHKYVVGAMQIENFLKHLVYGSLVILPGDRADLLLACISAVHSKSMPYISGIILTGGLKPEGALAKLIDGLNVKIPILSVLEDTFSTAKKMESISDLISSDDSRKICKAISDFEKNVNMGELNKKIIDKKISTVTPKMFEYNLVQKARQQKMHIVLPEGNDQRILKAAEILLTREIVDITLLGNKNKILSKIEQLGLSFKDIKIIEPKNYEKIDQYIETYYNLRKHKGVKIDFAKDMMMDESYFATMMIYKNDADGMVSGAVNTTLHTIKPALQFIKTKPGFSIVSSIFFMCLANKVLVYGDCAVNPDPNEKQLAEIGLSAAQTAKAFGIEPIVAFLSYSTGISGKGEDVDKVRSAAQIAKKLAKTHCPDLKIEGPIQYDAAVDASVAKTKMPESEVAGRATVLIFPDLDAGNNAYKAVQRSAGVVAIGPIMQGLNKPVNDLSRGCTVADIVNTVAITAIQAQNQGSKMNI